MWADILAALAERLTAADEELDVRVGGSAEVPLGRRVVLMRGPGTPRTAFAESGNAEQTVYVECWEHDEDSALANAALQALEGLVIQHLVQRMTRLLDDVDAIVLLDSIDPDNDAFRPTVGSRMTLRLRLRRATTT
jgi:hypothetical protein